MAFEGGSGREFSSIESSVIIEHVYQFPVHPSHGRILHNGGNNTCSYATHGIVVSKQNMEDLH